MLRPDAPPTAPPGPRIVVPTVVIGLGKGGGALVAAVRDEANAHGTEPTANARFIVSDGAAGLTEAFRAALDHLLGVAHTLRASRDGRSVPLDVFVVAELASDDVTPAEFERALGKLDVGFARYASLLQAGERGQRVFASPILMLPDMDAIDPAGTALREATVTLLASLAGRFGIGVERPLLPLARCWLVEPRTSHYVLDWATRVFMVRGFVRFLLFGSLRTDPEYSRVFEPKEDRDPFGSFVVACAELPGGGVLRELTAVEGAQRAMEAFERPSGVDLQPGLAAYQEATWVNELTQALPGAEVEKRVSDAIDRRVPEAAAGVVVARFLERPSQIHARVDPDWQASTRRALTVDDGDEVVGEALRTVVHHMAREGARRVDEHVAALDAELEEWLEGDNAAHHLDALEFLTGVEQVVAKRLQAEATRAEAIPDPGPDLALLDASVAELRTEVDKKADPWLLLPLGGLFVALLITLGAGLLPMLAGVFERPGADRPGWLVMLRDDPYSFVSATLIVLAGVGGFLLYRLWAQNRAINRQLGGASANADAVKSVIERLSGPGERSVRAFYESRYELARAHWRARALNDLLRGVRARRARMVRAQEAAHAQRRALDARSDRLKARLSVEAQETGLGVSVLPEATLREMVRAGAARTMGELPVQRTKMVLHPYRTAPLSVPFADVEPLVDAVRRGAGAVTLSDVLQSEEHATTARARILGLVADVAGLQRLGGGAAAGTRLHLPLRVVGLEDDPRGVANLDRPRVFAPERVLELLRRAPEQATPELLGAAKAFHDPDRAYVLQVAWGIHARSIIWLRDLWPAESGADPVIPIARARKSEEGR